MKRRLARVIVVALVDAAPPPTVYFLETGRHVGPPFLDY